MSFEVDQKAFRTFDRENGLELFLLSSGSDGTMQFRIEGPDVSYSFSAHYERLPENAAVQADIKDGAIPLLWEVHRWTEDSKPIIFEAMKAYVINHGSMDNRFEAFVRFGSRGLIS